MSVSENGSDFEGTKVLDENKNPPLLDFELSVSDKNKSINLINYDSIEKGNVESQVPEINIPQGDNFDLCPDPENVLNVSKNSSFSALADVSNANNNIDLSYVSDTKLNVSLTQNEDLMNMSASEFNTFSNGVIDENPTLPPEVPFDVFKHPDVVEHFPEKGCGNICMESDDFPDNNGINMEGEVFQDAVQFFKDPSSLQFLENLQTSEQTQSNVPRDSLYMTFDPLHKKFMQPSNPVIKEDIAERVVIGAEVDEPVKNDSDNLENKPPSPISNPISSVPPRESFGNILLSFDSPMKTNSAKNSVSLENPVPEVPKLYTEEELQQILKINELTMHEEFLKKQKEMEEEVVKKEQEYNENLKNSHKLNQSLIEILTSFVTVTSDLKSENDLLSSNISNLETEKEKLNQDLKTATEDLQSVEHTFSDFHRRYEQCKDMLKTYKDNEDHLKSQIENLNNQCDEQKEMNNMLQSKLEEAVEKANAEIANAKKGGDAQVAVLRAQLKKSELKVSSLESDLKQVKIENDKLSGICDDLMAKVSES